VADGDRPPGTVPVQLAELRRDVSALQGHDVATRQELGEVKEAVLEHRLRLENGIHVFAAVRKELDELEARTMPRSPSVYKIVGVTLALVMAGASALWGLSNMLRDRPTLEQVDTLMKGHDAAGHRDQIRAIQTEQVEQRALIEQVQSAQARQVGKIDELLDRVPKRR
jgi:hypothetical protein